MSFVLGLDAKMYYLSSGTRAAWPGTGAPANLELFTLVQNVTLNIELATADITVRGGKGWRQQAATLRNASVDFTLLWDRDFTTFPELQVLVDAVFGTDPDTDYLPGTIAMAILDGPSEHASGEKPSHGLWADFMITRFPRDEALENALTINVSATPTHSAVAPEWVVSNQLP